MVMVSVLATWIFHEILCVFSSSFFPRNEIVCSFVPDIRGAASLLNSTIGGHRTATLLGGVSPALSRPHSFYSLVCRKEEPPSLLVLHKYYKSTLS